MMRTADDMFTKLGYTNTHDESWVLYVDKDNVGIEISIHGITKSEPVYGDNLPFTPAEIQAVNAKLSEMTNERIKETFGELRDSICHVRPSFDQLSGSWGDSIILQFRFTCKGNDYMGKIKTQLTEDGIGQAFELMSIETVAKLREEGVIK